MPFKEYNTFLFLKKAIYTYLIFYNTIKDVQNSLDQKNWKKKQLIPQLKI